MLLVVVSILFVLPQDLVIRTVVVGCCDVNNSLKTIADYEQHPLFHIELVQTEGNFSQRIRQFNAFLHTLRSERFSAEFLAKPWVRPGPKINVVRGSRDDYLNLLSNYSQVTTVALPWLLKTNSSSSASSWNSLEDTSNLLIQTYFEWTADDILCRWIETPGTIKMKYDALFNRTCNRNINDTARNRSLEPTFLNGKPFDVNHYWPNDGNFYPAHFYDKPPPFVTYLHIHQNAVVTSVGDVYTGNLKLVLYGCMPDINSALPLGGNIDSAPFYEELFVIAQYWGRSVFHRMAEIAPRLAIHLDFLKANPQIRVLGPETAGGRLGELFQILGLDPARLVAGVARAKVVYQPRASGCGFANVPESQLLSKFYRHYIRHNLPLEPRKRLLLIRRSASRRFTQQAAIEEVVKQAAADYNMTYTLFIDNPTPSLEQTMIWFQSAVVIVAPHGAGLSNILFSEPGTFVVEGVCNLPHVNFCFQRLAHILGHHWHGVPSQGGCEDVVDVAAASIDVILRKYLRLM
jgi:hypothetical protein